MDLNMKKKTPGKRIKKKEDGSKGMVIVCLFLITKALLKLKRKLKN